MPSKPLGDGRIRAGSPPRSATLPASRPRKRWNTGYQRSLGAIDWAIHRKIDSLISSFGSMSCLVLTGTLIWKVPSTVRQLIVLLGSLDLLFLAGTASI